MSKHRLSELWTIFSGYFKIADRFIKLRLLFCLFCVKGVQDVLEKYPRDSCSTVLPFQPASAVKTRLFKSQKLGKKIVYMQRWRQCVTPLGKWQTVHNLILTNTSVRSQRISLTSRTWHISCSWLFLGCFFFCLPSKKIQDLFERWCKTVVTLDCSVKKGTNVLSTLIKSTYSFICVMIKYFYVPVLFIHLNCFLMPILNLNVFRCKMQHIRQAVSSHHPTWHTGTPITFL